MVQSHLDLLGELGRLETGKTLQRGLETGHSLLLMTIRPMPQTGVKVGLRQQGSPRPGCWHGNLLDHLPEMGHPRRRIITIAVGPHNHETAECHMSGGVMRIELQGALHGRQSLTEKIAFFENAG